MKLIILLTIVATVNASAGAYSQKITLSKKDVSLEIIFEEIEKQTGYDFLYNSAWLLETKKVTIQVENKPLLQVLDLCFDGQPLIYEIIDKTIALKKKVLALPTPSFISPATGAPIDVHGKVIDADGKPVPGVTVSIKGSSKITFTDENGEFSFKATEPDAILIFTSANMETYQKRLKGENTFSVSLKPKLTQLGEAVVTVSNGYQQIPKERSTGSFSFVNNDLLNKRVSSDIISKLEGNVAGLIFNRNTTNSNQGKLDISIRGHSTLFANDQPLIVLNGFPFYGDYTSINPNDVESITILKDAAAASIWGVRSGNGVIVISTKSAKRNEKLSLEFNSNLTIGDRPNLKYNPNFLDPNDFINVEDSLFNKGYYNNRISSPGHPVVSPVVQILAYQKAGTISNEEAKNEINALRSIDVRDDLLKYFYHKSVTQQYALNLRGGTDNCDYLFSVGFDNNRASQVGNSNNRITVNSNFNFYPIKNLILSTGVNYVSNQGYNNSPINSINPGGGYSIYPYAKLVNNDGTAAAITKDYAYSWVTDPSVNLGFLDWQYRPLDELTYSNNTSKGTDNRINVGIRYSFLNGFSAEAKYQYERVGSIAKNYYNDSTYFARNLINKFTQISNAGILSYPIPNGGILQQSMGYLTSQQGRVQLSYNHAWNHINQFYGIIGSEINSIINETNGSTVYGYDKSTGSAIVNIDYKNYFPIQPIGYGSAQIPNSLGFSRATDNYISYYSNLSYTYKEKYTITGSGRIDKSNLFGVATNQKSVPLYSAGMGWDISRENFFKVKWVPFLKLRATYGYTGNIDKNVAAVTTAQQYNNSYFSGIPYSTIINPGNPQLRWEKTRMTNIGIDFGGYKQILSGSFEYYAKKGIDLFGQSPLAPTTGVPGLIFTGNTANTKAHGMELVLNSRNISSKHFLWTSTLMLGYVKDIVTKYDLTSVSNLYLNYSSGNDGVIYPLTGKPLFAIYSYQWAGLSHDKGDPQGIIDGKPSADYATIIKNTTSDSLHYNGPGRPTTSGSFRNTVSYKQISLSINIVYKINYYFRRSSISYSGLFDNWSGNSDFYKRWVKPGDEHVTAVPSMPTLPVDGNRETFYALSSALIDKGDHIRLQDISISYSIDKDVWRKSPFTNMQIYGYVNNVGILWRANKDRLDPDLYARSTSAYPMPRTFTIGIKTSF